MAFVRRCAFKQSFIHSLLRKSNNDTSTVFPYPLKPLTIQAVNLKGEQYCIKT